MRLQKQIIPIVATAAPQSALIASVPQPVYAHCDTLDGRIVPDAQRFADEKEVDRVLKRTQSDEQALIRAASARTLKVRAAGIARRANDGNTRMIRSRRAGRTSRPMLMLCTSSRRWIKRHTVNRRTPRMWAKARTAMNTNRAVDERPVRRD